DRGLDHISAAVDEPDALSTGPQHGQPPGGDVAGDPASTSATWSVTCVDRQHRLAGLRSGPMVGGEAWREIAPVVAQTLTDQDADDPSQVGPLIDQIGDPIGQVTADGAYDGDPTYQTIAAHD